MLYYIKEEEMIQNSPFDKGTNDFEYTSTSTFCFYLKRKERYKGISHLLTRCLK